MTATSAPEIPAGFLAFLAGKALSPRQRQCAIAFYQLAAERGCQPTLREWAAEIGVCHITAYEAAQTLLRKGVLEAGTKHQYRRLRIAWEPPARDLAAENERLRAALRHYAGQANDNEVAQAALEETP